MDLKGLVFAFKPVLLAFYVIKCFGAVESFEGCTALGKKNTKIWLNLLRVIKPCRAFQILSIDIEKGPVTL